MGDLFATGNVKLILKLMVYSNVKAKWWSRGSSNLFDFTQPKAKWASYVKVNFAS
jgi:hypothetical protein